jgi:hypothetical protein
MKLAILRGYMKIVSILWIWTLRLILTLFTQWKIKKSIPTDRMNQIKREICELREKIKTIEDVEKELGNFKWVSDPIGGAWDYSPDIITFLYNSKRDDCDGAGYYCRWLFGVIGKVGTVFSLVSKDPLLSRSHVICAVEIDKGKYFLYSNGDKIIPEEGSYFISVEHAANYYRKIAERMGTIYYPWYITIPY